MALYKSTFTYLLTSTVPKNYTRDGSISLFIFRYDIDTIFGKYRDIDIDIDI